MSLTGVTNLANTVRNLPELEIPGAGGRGR